MTCKQKKEGLDSMEQFHKNKSILWIFTAIVIVCLVFLFIKAKDKEQYKIVFITKSINPEFDFWQTVKMGIELAAKEENALIEVRGPYYEKDIDRQKEILEETISQHPDIILLAAANTDDLADLIERAKKEKITLLTVDSMTEGVKVVSHVGTNNIEASGALARYVAQSIGQQGEVIMINFVEGVSTAKEREEGYKKEMEKFSKITVLPTVYSDGTVEGSYKIAKKVIKDYPNVKAIIGANQQTADGICEAILELDLSHKIKVVGFDSSDTIIYALEKGVMDAIIVQKPFNMGYLSVKYAVEAKRGKVVPAFLDTGYKFIDKDSLYLTENQKLLFPIIK